MCINKSTKILNRLKSDYEYVEGLGYTALGVFLQGSQNYSLDYEGSDIDTKCIILPKFEEFCLNKKPASTTLILPSNEHIDVKDIRLMFECFKKQNINFIEILFTDYKIINPLYEDLFALMLDNAEQIARYNDFAALRCMAGMSMEKYKALEHRYPTLIDKIDKYGYDPKQLHHIARLDEFIERYIRGDKYKECLHSNMADYLIDIKRGKYTLDEARDMAKKMTEHTTKLKEDYMAANSTPKINSEVEDIINTVLVETLKRSFKNEVNT
jgi:hypothetical protein